jgi:very-short-patch-repair endonuclease
MGDLFSDSSDSDLDRRAKRRGGILTRADLDAAGLSAGGVQRALSAGRIVRLRHGVFTTEPILAVTAGDPWALHALQTRAALSAAGDIAVAAGASAAALHGIDMFGEPPGRPILVRPVELSHKGRVSSTTRARVARLPECHRTSLLGWPVTTAARTIVDIGRRQDERCAVVAGDHALRNGLHPEALGEVLASCARAPGIRLARARLGFCDGRAESPLESLARLAMERGGVPSPELQFTIGPYRVDFCWPSAWLVLEVDGRQKYQHPGDLFSEKRREDWIRGQGYAFLRATWADVVHEPSVFCRRVYQPLLAAAS